MIDLYNKKGGKAGHQPMARHTLKVAAPVASTASAIRSPLWVIFLLSHINIAEIPAMNTVPVARQGKQSYDLGCSAGELDCSALDILQTHTYTHEHTHEHTSCITTAARASEQYNHKR